MRNRFAVGSHLYSNSEPSIFIKDMSTCCKKLPAIEKSNNKKLLPTTMGSKLPLTSIDSALPKTVLNVARLNDPLVKSNCVVSKELEPFSDPQSDVGQMLIIEQPLQNHIVLQTTTCVSSLTVNTGTQYIHNIYPDKNCAFTESSASRNMAPICTTKALNTILHTKSPVSCLKNADLPVTLPPPCDVSSICNDLHNKKNNNNEQLTLPLSSVSNGNDSICVSKDSSSLSACDSTVQVSRSFSTGGRTFVHDNDLNYSGSLSNKESSANLMLREKIKRKPMPKSKKQSLLRTVLMNESIESMKKHLQVDDVNLISSNSSSELSNTASSNEASQRVLSNLNVNLMTSTSENCAEEPFLKSIIQTATDRLLNLQKKTVPVLDYGSGHQTILEMNKSKDSTENSTSLSLKKDSPHNPIPKIKVRAVEELQEQRSSFSIEKNEGKVVNESDSYFNSVKNMNLVEKPQEVNVTGLKQGIIEASRTLVNTQKKLKELAKIISNKLSFKTDKTTEMITTFQDILRLCQKQIDVIDSNISSEYCNLIPNCQKKKILSSELFNKGSALNVEKKKQSFKYPKIHFSRSVSVPVKEIEDDDVVEETNFVNSLNLHIDSNVSDHIQQNNYHKKNHNCNVQGGRSVKRKLDSIDDSSINKKTSKIPEIIQDLDQINTAVDNNSSIKNNSLSMENAHVEQSARVLKKKKDIWSYKCRKRVYKRNTLIKKRNRGMLSSNGWNESENERKFFPRFQSHYKEERLRKRKIKFSRPLRSSERNHPSSTAYAARMFLFHEDESEVKPKLPLKYAIKPCSVMIHKLNPRIVELLENRVKRI